MEGYGEHVGKALKDFVGAFSEFTISHLKKEFPDSYTKIIKEISPNAFETDSWDAPLLISIISKYWDTIFCRINGFGSFQRTLFHELRHFRNQWAHNYHFNAEDAYRACDTIYRLIRVLSLSIDVTTKEQSCGRIKDWLLSMAAKEAYNTHQKKKQITGISNQTHLDVMDLE